MRGISRGTRVLPKRYVSPLPQFQYRVSLYNPLPDFNVHFPCLRRKISRAMQGSARIRGMWVNAIKGGKKRTWCNSFFVYGMKEVLECIIGVSVSGCSRGILWCPQRFTHAYNTDTLRPLHILCRITHCPVHKEKPENHLYIFLYTVREISSIHFISTTKFPFLINIFFSIVKLV